MTCANSGSWSERNLTAPWQEVLGQPVPGQKACDELEWGAQHNTTEVEQQGVWHVRLLLLAGAGSVPGADCVGIPATRFSSASHVTS